MTSTDLHASGLRHSCLRSEFFPTPPTAEIAERVVSVDDGSVHQ